MIVLFLGKKTPRIGSNSALRSTSSNSHKGISPSNKRDVVIESEMVKYTRQIASLNLLIVITTEPLVLLLLQI